VIWWRGWDSNPRHGITVNRISSPAHSTTLPPLRQFKPLPAGFGFVRRVCAEPWILAEALGCSIGFTHRGPGGSLALQQRNATHIGSQRFRHGNGAIGVLTVFEDRDERATHGQA
jgi:hypothetical protein